MFQGNWPCSKCDKMITELPFEPRSDKGLTCRECYFKEKDAQAGGGQSMAPAATPAPAPSDMPDDAPPYDPSEGAVASEPAPPPPDEEGEPIVPGERKMFTGSWPCSQCDQVITQLPFEPRSTENLKCLDCFKASKA